jgi:hypothetical protein
MNSFHIFLYEFLLSSWLFSMTYDWFHLILNTFVLCIFLSLIARVSLARSILLSFSAHFFAFMIFTVCAVGLFIYHIAIENMPSELTEVAATKDLLISSLRVGGIYAFLQGLFVGTLHIGSELSVRKLLLAVILSNLTSSLLSYFCITTLLTLLV